MILILAFMPTFQRSTECWQGIERSGVQVAEVFVWIKTFCCTGDGVSWYVSVETSFFSVARRTCHFVAPFVSSLLSTCTTQPRRLRMAGFTACALLLSSPFAGAAEVAVLIESTMTPQGIADLRRPWVWMRCAADPAASCDPRSPVVLVKPDGFDVMQELAWRHALTPHRPGDVWCRAAQKGFTGALVCRSRSGL